MPAHTPSPQTATAPTPRPDAGPSRTDPTPADPSPADPSRADLSQQPLQRERAHLASSRAALRAMRADVESLDLRDVTGNWVNAAILQREVSDRIKALADLAHTPLFFGRLDYLHAPGRELTEGATGNGDGSGEGEQFYIGRRHVHDSHGDPMVIDWRAPVSQPFYRASRKDPLDVGLRRRFGYTGGELTAYEDEHLTDAEETEQTSALLAAEIERPRVGPMRDIVATIQPEQDEIVRADVNGTVCVQGAPGTGKTAVGLHRVAYLLYAHRERLARTGTLVIGPNRSFLHYIEQVLPALGELDVAQATVEELVGHVAVTGADPAVTAIIKGDARMARVLRNAVRDGIRMPAEPCVVVRGSRRWRIPAYELEEITRELMDRDIRYGAALAALPQRIAHAVLVKMENGGEAPDDRVQDAVARNAAVKATVKAIWPAVDPAKLVFRLLSDAEFLARCADGVLTAAEQQAVLWPKPPRGVRSAPWSLADAVLVDEARDLVERTHSLGHVVLDEAQDLSPMQYRAVGRRCTTGSATVLGDIAQGTTPWATATWAEALEHLGKPDSRVEALTKTFRVPSEVIRYASRLLPGIAPDLAPAESVRESEGALTISHIPSPPPADDSAALDATVSATPAELTDAVIAASRETLRREGSIGLIAADDRVPLLAAALRDAGLHYLDPGVETSAETRLTLVPASLAKGLEYDHVVLDEPAAIIDGEPDLRTGLRRLYVCLTRPVSGLTVLHSRPLPPALVH
ncbi:AAA family ATPase [Streptacidiphilus sp. EB129]|uniref:HelD family protein n=1 Tax=Streptacidiphilus sp. EB129 TaxID=3156262 RepID=UPI0035143DC0